MTPRSVMLLLRIPWESFLVSPTSSTLYALDGGLGDYHGCVVVDGVALVLVGEVDDGGEG